MTSKTPLKDAIVRDHREIDLCYEEYQKATDNDIKSRWAHQLTWEVARHSVGEEIVVYPLLEKRCGEQGEKMAKKDREEHLEVKHLLSHLETLKVGSHDYDLVLGQVMNDLHEHIGHEESNDLPMLEEHLQGNDSQNAVSQFAKTKQMAPTRAHPMAPDKPPFETVAGFLALPIDKIKDYFDKFPTEEMKRDARQQAGL
ncbi:hypothetical protein HYDPIDRAFT_164627 [Hydnomerulius pinastri MD-312]|nr:hypothetical protein HYDPIDRAFT_164627 [Hydnomerulius pinastri MD-312]